MLLGPIEENLICLLVMSDEQAKIIRNAVPIELWGGPYRIIAVRCYDYLDRFKVAPKQHIADLLLDKLNPDSRESQLYINILDSINNLHPEINVPYVMGSQLEPYLRRQSLRAIQGDLTRALQRDTDQSLDEAEALIGKATARRLSVFDPGTRLSDKKKALAFLDVKDDAFPTGIPEFDKRGFGPTRKELWLGIANTKGGKSWALMHLAKCSLMAGLKVSHITLEMSETRRCNLRYFQALFAVGKRLEAYRSIKIKTDELGNVTGFDDVNLTPRYTLDDPNIRVKLERIIDKWSTRMLDRIFIKEFSSLTVPQLESYLDDLEATQRFTPDLLIVDYPDLMKLDKNDLRISLGETYKDLRSLAIRRNLALAVVSQSNRGAAKAKSVGSEDVAEAYAKIAHADCVVTISQTDSEKELNLARLKVTSGRNDADGIQVVVSQQYGLGNFAFSSALVTKTYWQMLPDPEGGDDE